MDRNREVRRGQPMANGLSRRRPQRTGGSGMRDSPEEAVAGEMQETAAVRLRDRKKDRLSRSKRRRGERLHGNREEGGEESSEESVDVEEEDDDEDEDSLAADHRRSIPPPAAKIVKPPWKVPDEMIGVPVPRKARSASVKRSHENAGSGVGGGEQIPTLRQCSTSPATPSASSVSPPSNAPIRRRVKPIGAKQRPTKVSKVSIQEEIEIEVAEVLFGLRQYPAPAVNPELAGNPSSLKMEDREEESPALLEKPRASSPISPQQSVGVQPKVSSSMSAASPSAGAPKRKRPRPVKSEEEKAGVGSGGVSTVLASFVVKDESEKMEVSSPRGDKRSFTMVPNGVDGARSIKLETNQEARKADLIPDEKPSSAEGPAEEKVVPEVICSEKSEPQVETTGSVKPGVTLEDATKGVSSCLSTCDSQKEEKLKFDLMAPPARSMVDGDMNGDSTSEIQAVNAKEEISVVELKEKAGEKVEQDVPSNDSEPEKRAEMCGAGEQAKQNKDRIFDLRMDEEKSDREGRKQQGHKHSKVAKGDMKAPEVSTQWEKSASHSSSTAPAMSGPSPMPHMTIAGWPAGLPPLGYIGQAPASWPGAPPVQAVVSMEGNTGAPTLQPHILLPHQRHKRCATHCYIAKMINYLQHVARMNPFWAAASNASLFGAKPYNLNTMPSTEGMILGGPLSGAFPAANFTASGRTTGSTHEKGNGSPATFGGQVPKEKATAQIADGQRRQQTTVQQPPLALSATNIPHGPAIIFPLNQVAAAVRPGGSKAPVTGHAAGPSAAQVGGVMGSPGAAATVSYNYPNLPTNEAQYIAMVQSSGYPFQIPAHVGAAAAASAYRGSSAHLGQAAAAPPPQFFTGSFYASQMLHPSQIQQTQSQALQQGQQNPSTSSGSSSSHKHPQQQHLQGCGGSNSNNYKQQQQLQQESQLQSPQRTHQSSANSVHPNHHLNASHPRQSEAGHPAETDNPSAADGKVSSNFLTQTNHHHPTLGSSYGISPLPVPIHHAQNFSNMSSLGSTKNGEKPHLQPQSSDPHPQYGLKGMELVPSQTFAMSFPPGIDFSMAQGHHPIFQNLPEHYRQGYQLAAAQAVAAAASVHQQHVQRTSKQKIGNDSKNAADHISGAVSQEERTAGGAKATPSVASQTLTFSRQPENNNENASISILSSSSTHVSTPAILENQSRSLNLVSAPANGTRVSCPTSISSTNIQQTQLMARSKSSTSNPSVPTVSLPAATAISYTDRLPLNMFPRGLPAFPQALLQGTTPQSSPQWKSATAAVPSTRTMGSASVSSPPRQPKGPVTGPGGSPAHSQISFASTGVNAKVTAMPMGGHVPHVLPNSSLSSSVSNAAPARLNSSTPVIGSPPQSVAKTSGSPSTRSAPATKGGVLPAPVPSASQPPKNSHTSSTRKSSPPLGGRNNLPAILGHPQLVQSSSPKQSQQQQQPVQSLNLKSQQQTHQQHNKAQYQPAQMFFSKNYLAPQSSQVSQHAAAGYYPKPSSSVQPSISNLPQRRPSSDQSQNSPSVSSNSAAKGALSLSGSSLSLTTSASESLKSGCASNATPRGGSVGVLHTHQFTTPLSTAANPANNPTAAAVVAAAFPYLHAVSTVPMKSAEHSSAGSKHKQEKIQ